MCVPEAQEKIEQVKAEIDGLFNEVSELNQNIADLIKALNGKLAEIEEKIDNDLHAAEEGLEIAKEVCPDDCPLPQPGPRPGPRLRTASSALGQTLHAMSNALATALKLSARHH